VSPTVTRPAFRPRRTDPCFCGSGERFKACCGSMAPERNPPHGVHIVPGFLDRATCLEWVAYFERQAREFVQIVDHDRSKAGQTVYRRDETRVTERVHANRLKKDVEQLLAAVIQQDIAQSTGRSFSWYIGPQILRYQPGGFYGPHADSDHYSAEQKLWVKGLDRDISLLLYLNDDYSGGALSFVNFNYRYRPRAGDLLFFPSDQRYLHRAHEVTEGIRYVIVSWAAFADEPRVQASPPDNRIDFH
jgi:predicted 2-oxoglutarate/Fe(II)-dependent dioxygenase YbiX